MAERNTLGFPPIALLAGGLATRLGAITKVVPKSLVTVAGRPFIEHQLELLAHQGVTDVVACVGHLGEQVESLIGDGARFGCRVRYSWDGETLLGTGGALRQALPQLGEVFFVMNGDSYLPTSFAPVWQAFCHDEALALMTVFRNEGRWDTSNVELRDGRIVTYDKTQRTPAMHHIDYGLGILKADALRKFPAGERFDLADVYRDLVRERCVAAYEVKERFYEVGSFQGLADTDAFLRATADPASSGSWT